MRKSSQVDDNRGQQQKQQSDNQSKYLKQLESVNEVVRGQKLSDKRLVSVIEDGKDSYQNYLHNNQNNLNITGVGGSEIISGRGNLTNQRALRQSVKQDSTNIQLGKISALSGSMIAHGNLAAVNQNISIEDVVRGKMRKNQNVTQLLPEAVTKISGFQTAITNKDIRTPSSLLTQIVIQGGRYSSANVSPNTVDRSFKIETQMEKPVSRLNFQKQLSESAGANGLELTNHEQQYGIDNYSYVKAKPSEASFAQHKGLLRNEILRQTQTPSGMLSNQNIKHIDQNSKQIRGKDWQDLLARKEFEQQQSLQVSQSNDMYRGTNQVLDYKKNTSKLNQYRKDGKNIGDLLSYKDYALENGAKNNFKTTKNSALQQMFDMSMSSDQMRNAANYSMLIGGDSNQNDNYQEEKQHRLLKNSYHPTVQKVLYKFNQLEFISLYKIYYDYSLQVDQVRAKSQIKIPETLLNAFQRRNQLNQSNVTQDGNQQVSSGFHITDLLNYDKKKNNYESFLNSSNQTPLDFSNTNQPNIEKGNQANQEYVIKNYRLIQKKKRDFFLPITNPSSPRKNHNPFEQSNTAPQSPIRVSNSILSPNIAQINI